MTKIESIPQLLQLLQKKPYLVCGYYTEPLTWQYRINHKKVLLDKLYCYETETHLYILSKRTKIVKLQKKEIWFLECALSDSWDINNKRKIEKDLSPIFFPEGGRAVFDKIYTPVTELTDQVMLKESYNFIYNTESFKNLKKSERKAVRVWSENPDLSFVYVRPYQLTVEQKEQIRELRDEWLGARANTERSDADLEFSVIPLILNPEKYGIDLSLSDGYVFLFYLSGRLVAMTYSYKRNKVVCSYLGFSSRTAKGIDIYTSVKELEVWSSLYPDSCIDFDMGVSDDLLLSKFKLKLNPSKILHLK